MQGAVLHRQKGAALIVGLLMLTMLTIMVLSAVMLSTANLKAVGNMQYRYEAETAASLAIEQVLDTEFMAGPTEQTVAVDIDQDGNTDYQVVITHSCVRTRIVPLSELDPDDSDDQVCFLSGGSNSSGLDGQANPNSACVDALWQIRAAINDQATGAAMALNQGVNKRMSQAAAGNYCA